PPLAYFTWIIFKGTLDLVDAGILLALYAAYLVLLQRTPSPPQEHTEDGPYVVRRVLSWEEPRRRLGVIGLFLIGGIALYYTAHPFLESIRGVAITLGVSQFVFVQWVAPF